MQKNAKTLHQQLREYLLGIFADMDDGDRVPTEVSLAEKFDVSRLTVHKVLNELQREGYIVRKAGKGSFISHGDRKVVGSGPWAENGRVVMAYPDWFSFDIWTKRRRARQLAHSNSMSVIDYMITMDSLYTALRDLVEDTDDVKGVIVVPPAGPMPEETVSLLESLGVPVVVLGANMSIPNRFNNVYQVYQDYKRVGYLAVKTLLDRGQKKVAYIASEPLDESTRMEVSGMKQALRDAGLPIRTLWVSDRHAQPWELACDVAAEITRDFLQKHPPCAMIFDSIPDAMGGVRSLWENGHSIEGLDIVVTANWFGVERAMVPPPIMISCDVSLTVDEAFRLILGGSAPAKNTVRIKDISVVEPESMNPVEV